jgi:hypothetical protein
MSLYPCNYVSKYFYFFHTIPNSYLLILNSHLQSIPNKNRTQCPTVDKIKKPPFFGGFIGLLVTAAYINDVPQELFGLFFSLARLPVFLAIHL